VLAGAIDAASTGHDTFAEYDAADLIKVIGTLPKYAEANARWYGHRTAWANTFLRLVAAAGGNAIMDIQAGGKPQAGYLGYPFETDQTLPSALTDLSDTAVVLFGDLNAAVTMGERRGITIDVTRDRYWELRQIGIMGWERIDINVHDIGDATNPGPLVALMAE
jgi:HK97 family phage major capsid protein